MRDTKWGRSLVAALWILGCGEPPPGGEPTLTDEPRRALLTASPGASAEWKGCLYALTAEARDGARSASPVHDIRLHRTSLGTCPFEEQHRLLDTSHAPPTLSLVAGDKGLAVGHSLTGASPAATGSRFNLWHLAPDSLDVLRRESLSASICPRGMGTCLPGGITQASLAVSGDALVVEGTKSGIIPGEVGEGTRFTATYPDFFTTQAAPTVLAPPDEHASYASVEWSGCHFFAWSAPERSDTPTAESLVYVTRLPGRGCPWRAESRLIDRTFQPGPVALMGGASGLAAGYKRHRSATADAPVSLRLLQLSWDALQAGREENLEVWKDTHGLSHPGAISLVHLSVLRDESLVVLGHKDGTFAGEPGSALRFQLSFQDFFTSTRPPTFGAF